MSRRSNRKKKISLERAAPAYLPGGAFMYVPPGMANSIYGQTFYGGSTKNTPVGQTSLFSPGMPLPTQQGVNPDGLPVQFKFPVSYNTFPPDRSLQRPDMPSFEQLRNLAKLDYGIGLCEQYILGMVLKLDLKIVLTDEAVKNGAEEQDYQDEMSFFRDFFSKPDGNISIHEWIQQALVEQTQIDELYIYKNKTRGGKLLKLEIVDGSQMKPLLDDWGRVPVSPQYAFQQYPWGIPGWQYTTDQMIHRRETPATDTPYGRSRVERVLIVTNLALNQIRQYMSHYKRNVPAGILMPPGDGSSRWTPDELDAYQQSWDALLAANPDLLASIRVVQPGFQYTPFVQPSQDAVMDRYWLNIRASAYRIPMDVLGFTETSNRSTGEVQKDVLYEQTIGPFVAVYESIFTESMHNDFDPSLHGKLFRVKFGGYEPPEDEQSKAATLTMYTGAGVLGLSAAAKLAGLPEDPDAKPIGRVYMSKDGPVFLDDMASDEMRKAAATAKLAGFQMAANPPEPNQDEEEGDDKNEQGPSSNAKSQKSAPTNSGGGNSKDASGPTKGRAPQSRAAGDYRDANNASDDYRKWRTRAIEDVKQGRVQRAFQSSLIPEYVHAYLSFELDRCLTADDVRELFKRVQEHQLEVVGS